MTQTTPEKPAYGSPCNGCGMCCIAEQCPISQMLFGEHDLCPALTRMGNVYACGLLCDTARYAVPVSDKVDSALRAAIAYLLGAGRGCDARLIEEDVPEGVEKALRADLKTGTHAMNLLIACAPLFRAKQEANQSKGEPT